MRQQFIANHYVFPFGELDMLLSPTVQYQALPRKVAQWVLKQVCDAWASYKAAVADYRQHPEKYKGHPKLPTYLNKQGRNLLVYTDQAISRDPKNAGWIVPSGVPIRVATKLTHAQIAQVRLVPKATIMWLRSSMSRNLSRRRLIRH
jgi:putative transposase